MLLVPRTSFETAKTDAKLLSAKIVLWAHLVRTGFREPEEQAVCEAANARYPAIDNDVNNLVQLYGWQAESNRSV